MSNFLSAGRAHTGQVTATVNDYLTSGNAKLNGTNYSHYGSRSGLGSFLDSNLIDENLKRQRDLLGSGFIKLAKLNADGTPVTTAQTMNMNGKLMQSDDKGCFLIIDGTAVNVVKKREEERRNYLEGLVSDASVSDEVCAMMTGCGVGELENRLKVNGTFNKANGRALEASLQSVDAMPSAIHSYDPTSITYSQAIRKLKLYISEVMPVVENLTNEQTLRHGDEKTL